MIASQNFLSKQVKLLEYQDSYWKVKAKSNHLKLVDVDTKYYHACASIRKNRNRIETIQDPSNNTISHPNLIENCITSAFIQRFIANPSCSLTDLSLLTSIISEEDNVLLCRDVTLEEVEEVVFF